MDIRMSGADKALARNALALLEQETKKASKQLVKVGLPTTVTDTQTAWIEHTRKTIGTNRAYVEMLTEERTLLRSALLVLIGALGKTREAEEELELDTDSAMEKESAAQTLFARLGGQTDALDESGDETSIETVTFSTAGREPVTMSGSQFERAVDRIAGE